jgi:hypothetical protein
MSKTKKAVRWPLSRPKYVASGLNFSMKAEIAFCSAPDFSASLPWVASSLPLVLRRRAYPATYPYGRPLKAALGKGQPPILAAATRNTERRRMRAPQLGLQRPSTRSGCCSSKRGRWCRLPTPPGGALFREGAGGLGDRLLRLRSHRPRGRRGGRGLGGAGLHGAHPRLTQEASHCSFVP